MRVGRKMAAAVAYVQQMQLMGQKCTMMRAAEYVAPKVGPGGHRLLGYGYNTIHRCLDAGLLKRVERSDKRGCYWLEVGQ